MTFRLYIEGKDECSLAFDQAGKHHFICGEKMDEIHRFCRTVLAIIDALPTGYDYLDGLPPSIGPASLQGE